jgi:5-(carboxyamino)imidazole ribonucleotide synthase
MVDSEAALRLALSELGTPAVLKTADFGYDGKGQIKISGDVDASEVWKQFGAPRGVLEKWIPFQAELSVVCARGRDGTTITFPASENIHSNHILDLSIIPARFEPFILKAAENLAAEIMRELGVVGLMAVEFFLTTDGTLLVNELAPRPHNSGHFTLDACITSQFEQQLRAVCGLPLGSPELMKPIVMWNLLGDLWENGAPNWNAVLSDPRAKLHLYGKSEARPGRKMGHACLMAETVEEALEGIKTIRAALTKK